ncbi:site-specific tyrosine recombinase XerC [Bremerella volcania]|uniref:Site-specific tyrosine recombinase XerC n=1 Tax=Bremerella volcania TaxID=2527984 RepID=A0A518CB37_9BACT|nr:phage integrase SAM-like domain-containing protein [Bremerella volcania]QDU76442.1 site-specific tyrosine recombinase XerC [Bremerella volcania]
MASIQQRGKGSFLIQFYDKDGRKRGVSISRSTKKFANNLAMHIEAINGANRSGHPLDGSTAQWLSEIGDTLAGKLAKVDLIKPRSVKTLGQFLKEYFAERSDWKLSTQIKHNTSRNHLLAHIDESTPLREITEAHADSFVRYLKNDIETMKSTATRSKVLSNVKEYFRAAVRKRLISASPFAGISLPKQGADRYHYVTQDQAGKVLEACPDTQWRLIFALARYGGVRIPSEINGLEWSHVLWDQNKILIHSPKTEHHDGRDKRLIPIFPELRPFLDDAWEIAQAKGYRYLIMATRSSDGLSAAYIRKRMLKIIEKSGTLP